jgi:hypothetical protein
MSQRKTLSKPYAYARKVTNFTIMVQRSIGVKKRKQDVIAFVNTMMQFIHRGSYAHIVTVRKFS